MAIDGISNNILRFSGLATGLDTDNMIKQLMTAEKIPLTRLNQQKILLGWRRDNYREITNTLRGFRDQFMDILNPLTNMRSANPYKAFDVSSTNEAVVTATATSSASKGEYNITQIKSLASAATVSSGSGVTKPLTSNGVAATDFTSGNNQFNITVDGVTKTISLRKSSAYNDVDDLVNNATDGIQKLIDDAFGAGKITVTGDIITGKVNFTSATGTSKITLTDASTNNALGALQFNSGDSNRLNTGESLETLAAKINQNLTFDGSDNITFKINNVDFSFNKSQTLNEVMNAINSSSAGVEIKYSEVTDKFSVTAKDFGAGDNIIIENLTGTLFGDNSAINIAAIGDVTSVSNGAVTSGTDAEFTLDGVTIKRSENNFTIDGITYALKTTYNDPIDASNSPIKITVNQDTEAIYENIKSFVDKYNEVIGKINAELLEKYDRDYPPLTDEQKEEMTEDEIKLWEEKAKEGLLRNDSVLQKIVSDMRRSIYDTITDVSGNIFEIGIKTSSDYKERGQLVIDEIKLKEAIQKNPDKVQNIFSKESSIGYSPDLSSAERKQRYDEEGIVNRLYDIIQDNIRTTRDLNGNKGILLEKAGVIGDVTEFQNIIDKQIDDKEEEIFKLQDRLYEKEEYYYRMFASLEQAIAQMNNQSAWLYQQMGGGQ